ncbi:MAG: DUF2510 domain-containing protein [Acidimicrobiales bacterium]
MFTGLGLVDWIALVIAAVLLAMAVAAVALGMMARNHRRRTPRAVAATSAATAVARATAPDPPMPEPSVIDLRDDGPATARASRAHRLRRPPIPEASPRKPVRVADTPKITVRRTRQPSGRAGFDLRAPGFFEDPIGRHEFRYWDGEHWTEHVKEHGERFIDPL